MRLRLDSSSRFPAARRSRGFCGLCSFSRRNGARSSTRNSVRYVDWKFRRSMVKYTVRGGSTSFVAFEWRTNNATAFLVESGPLATRETAHRSGRKKDDSGCTERIRSPEKPRLPPGARDLFQRRLSPFCHYRPVNGR